MSAENDNELLPEELETADANNESELVKEIAALRAEAEAHKDRTLRALAEVENVRKRLEREREEARTYSVSRFARDVLTIADNLSRALAAFTPEVRERADEFAESRDGRRGSDGTGIERRSRPARRQADRGTGPAL